MPVVRPQFNKTLQRVKLSSQLESTMAFVKNNTTETARQLRLMSALFNLSVQSLKQENVETFLKKQPLVDKDLNSLVNLIEDLKKGLDDLKTQSSVLQQFMETDLDKEDNGVDCIDGGIGSLSLSSGKKVLNGNSNGVDGQSNGNGVSNGSNGCIKNGKENHDLVIDPLKWEPPQVKVSKGKPMDVYVSHVESPSDFYIQPYSGVITFLLKLQKEQTDLIIKGVTELPNIERGMYCCARYHEDFYWYRARIIDIIHPKGDLKTIEKVKVFYLDYGNCAEVKPDELMPMAKSAAEKTVCCVNCHVQHQPEGGWPAEAVKIAKEKMSEKRVQCIFSEPAPRISEFGQFPFYPVDISTKDQQSIIADLNKFIK